MTLQEFVSKYDGQYVNGGQCGDLVRQYWIEVDLTDPPSYTDSKDYWFNPVPGYVKSPAPIPGAIAIYDAHGGYDSNGVWVPDLYKEGHSAIYIGNGQVFEQNADPNGSPAHTAARANTYLLGYLIKEDIVAGVTIQGSPGSISWSEQRLDVFARGSDNNLWHKWWDGSWHPWEQVGTSIFSDPTVASWGVGRLDIFGAGINGDLIHFWYDAQGYHGPESLGQPQ